MRWLREICADWRDVVQIKKLLRQIKYELRGVNKTMGELDNRVAAVESKLNEASAEILRELEILRNETLSEEGRASFARVEAIATAMTNVSPPIPPAP